MIAKEISKDKFQNNKYSRWYWQIIEKAQQRNTVSDFLMEKHHVLPKGKFMFPEYKCLKTFPWNSANLTLREHFICHLLLTKMTTGNQYRSAVYGLMRFS